MPVLLRATGAGSRPAPSATVHRPPSQVSTDHLRAPGGGNASARRVSQLSATPSHAAAQAGVRRTVSTGQPTTWKTKFRALIKRYHLKSLFPLFFIMIYMVVGALLFYWMESSNDAANKQENNFVYKRERELLRRRMEEIMGDKAARKRLVRRRLIDEAVDYYEEQIGFEVKNQTSWDLMSSMYFSGTLFTTIGYGDIVCVTTAGRIMTVIYSCVGIPLMLITLNDLGKFLYNNINGCVETIDSAYLGVLRICRPAKTVPQSDEVDMVERGENADVSSLASQIGSEHDIYEVEDDARIPRMSVKVALGITIGWILVCAQLFRLWEDWTYGESLYFMYISCSTIGLGDIAVGRRDMMVLCFVFVIVGLSLVSMTINVVQVALEDFYTSLIMKLVMEYQEKMAAGGDQMGASIGMMRMFSSNKTAKLLMPLLSKENKRMAMDRVQKEAKVQGFEIPPILTDIDEKTGIPKLLMIQESGDGEDAIPSLELEEMVQKQILLEESALIPIYMAHDADTQTETVCSLEIGEQTEDVTSSEDSTQTDEEKKRDCVIEETQTEQTEGRDVEAQTAGVETTDADTATQGPSNTHTEVQTELRPTTEQEMQTYIAESSDAQNGTEIETKNIRIQTPCPIIEQRTIQTEDMEERKSPSKMSSARKRLRRAFAPKTKQRSLDTSPAMSEWKEVEEEDGSNLSTTEEVEDEGSVESLHWDPVDGMHAEKQLPVSRLTAMFDRQVDTRKRSDGRKYSSFKKTRESSRSRKTSE